MLSRNVICNKMQVFKTFGCSHVDFIYPTKALPILIDWRTCKIPDSPMLVNTESQISITELIAHTASARGFRCNAFCYFNFFLEGIEGE